MKKKKKSCKNCDYKNPIKKGRACYVCRKCGKDITIELLYLEELKSYKRNTKVSSRGRKNEVNYI